MQEMNEQYKNYPVQFNNYEVDGRTYRVHSHFVGYSNIHNVMYQYAEIIIMSERLGTVPKTTLNFFSKAFAFLIRRYNSLSDKRLL